MQLNNLVFTVVGSSVQYSFTFILGVILGCYYEYRLTLVMFYFVPFIAIAIIVRRGLNHGSGKRGVKANVEAGGILSECVTNTKTIYSFNFQKAAVDMYMGVLEYSIIAGIFVGLGQFCIFAGNSAVMAMAKHYILNREIDSEDMDLAMNIVLTSAGGIGNGLSQLGDLKKVNIAFKSIYSTLDTETLINPFKRDNEGKVSAKILKEK